jgi:hypothetical protein
VAGLRPVDGPVSGVLSSGVERVSVMVGAVPKYTPVGFPLSGVMTWVIKVVGEMQRAVFVISLGDVFNTELPLLITMRLQDMTPSSHCLLDVSTHT